MVIVLLFCFGLNGQTFEVAFVKPHDPSVRGAQGVLPACKDGRFVAAMPMLLLIRWIYDLPQFQTSDLTSKLPRWAQGVSGAYDLEATYTGGVSEDQCRQMVENLLVERFKFASHWETKTGTVYNLIVAPGGPKMPPVREGDESHGVSQTINGKSSQRLPDAPSIPGLTMDELARLLSNLLRTTVVNKTNLQGLYKIKLAYSQGAAAEKAFADPDLPTAIQQQLGLKLEEGKGTVSHFVLDHIEMPTEN